MMYRPVLTTPATAPAILVIEDNPITRRMLRNALESARYTVLEAADAHSAIALVVAHQPGLIIQNLLLPDIDGFDLVRRLRALPGRAELPILALSGALSHLEAAQAEAAGFTELLIKPIDPSQLLQAVKTHLPPVASLALSRVSAAPLIRPPEQPAATSALPGQDPALQTVRFNVLARISEILTRTVQVEEALGEVLACCLEVIGISQGAMYLIEPDGVLTLHAQIGYPAGYSERLAGFFDHMSVLFGALAAGDIVTIPSEALPAAHEAALLASAWAQSLLIVPLVSGAERLGVIVMASARRGLGEDGLSFAKVVGFQVSQALVLGRTVARLADSQQRYRDLVENLDAIVWEADPATFQFSYVSRQAEAILGYPAEQWLTQPNFWIDHLHPDDRERSIAFCSEAVAEGRNHEFEYRAIAADGRIIWLHDIVRVIWNGAGRPAKLRGLMVDISGHKLLEEQLRQSQKMEGIGRLAGGVAHDFNNLLTAITGYCDLLLADLEQADTRYADIGEIRKAADRATDLTRQLLAFSRKQALEPRVLDLNVVVANMDKMLRRVIGEDIDLITLLDPVLGRVRADPGQIEQVLMNLVVNARDAMPNGGRLTIETTNIDLDTTYTRRHISVRAGVYVMLAVSDTGSGMDQETLSHLFEPFFTTKPPGKGTGMGLSTVYGIVKQSGGDIWPYSEPEHGTTFKIYLPRVDEPLSEDDLFTMSDHTAPAQGRETILLAEDEPAVQALLHTILDRNGYTVLAARRGSEAEQIASEYAGPIHLLLTDMVMPEMSGRMLAERLMAVRPALRVLYISGYTNSTILQHDVQHADVLFLQKPFSPSDLLRRVRLVLDATQEESY